MEVATTAGRPGDTSLVPGLSSSQLPVSAGALSLAFNQRNLNAYDSVPVSWAQPTMMQQEFHDLPSVSALGMSPAAGPGGYLQMSKTPSNAHMQFASSLTAGANGNVDEVIGNLESVEAAGLGRSMIDLEEHGFARAGSSDNLLANQQAQQQQRSSFVHKTGSIEEDMFGVMGGLDLNDTVDADTPRTVSHSMSSGSLSGLAEDVSPSSTSDQASRSLFVRNVSISATDDDIRSLFEAYGDVRNVYTACRGRGFVVVSFYDLRAAMKAVQVLQGYSWLGSTLEIHYSQPRTNPSESGINQLLLQGMVVVFNLDPNTTDDQLLWIFKKFGDVREVRQNPTRRNQKFIEFFDIRHAAAAMRAMNKAELAGSMRGGAALPQSASTGSLGGLDTVSGSSPQVLQPMGMPVPSGSMETARRAISRPPTMGSLSMHDDQGAGQQPPLSQSWDPSVSASVDGLFHLLQHQAHAQAHAQAHVQAQLQAHAEAQAHAQAASSQQAQQVSALSQLLAQAQAHGQGGSLAALASAAAGSASMHAGMQRSLSAVAMSALTGGMKAQITPAGGSAGQLLGQGGRQGLQVSDSASSMVNNPQLHSGPYAYSNSSMVVADLQGAYGAKMGLVMGGDGAGGDDPQRLTSSTGNLGSCGNLSAAGDASGALQYGGQQQPQASQQQSYLWSQQIKAINDAAAALAGSSGADANQAAALIRALYQQHQHQHQHQHQQHQQAASAAGAGMMGHVDLAELQARQQQQQMAMSLLGASGSPAMLQQHLGTAQLLQQAQASGLTPQTLAAAGLLGNQISPLQMLQSAAGLGIPGLSMLHPTLGLKSASASSLTSLASGSDRNGRGGGRLSRRAVDPSADAERKAQQEKLFALDREKIMSGEDKRTTLMIKNIPNKYTQKMLLATIDEHMHGSYDFFYLPIDFKNKCNVGYAFINMCKPALIVQLVERFDKRKWERFNSEKVCSISYARIQGKAALVAHFQNSSLMHEDKRCRPVLFYSDGPEAGEPEPFPVGPNVRARLPHSTFKEGAAPAKAKDK